MFNRKFLHHSISVKLKFFIFTFLRFSIPFRKNKIANMNHLFPTACLHEFLQGGILKFLAQLQSRTENFKHDTLDVFNKANA